MRERQISIITESRKASALMVESRSISEIGRLLEEKESKEVIEKGLLAKIRDSEMLDAGLDMLSAIGVGLEVTGAAESATGIGAAIGIPSLTVGAAISIVADTINAIRYAARGDYLGAAMYVIFAVPLIGDVLQLGKSTKSMIKIMKWMRDSSNSAKKAKLLAATSKLVELGIDKVPGAEKHREPLKNAVGALASGDPKKIADVARKSGQEMVAKELDDLTGDGGRKSEDESKDLAESFSRSRKKLSMLPLYKGTLY